MAKRPWLMVEYDTTNYDTRFTILPKSALLNWRDEFDPNPLFKIIAKYAAVLGKLTPAAIVNYADYNEEDVKGLCDEITLCYLIEAHDLTFTYSDDNRYYSSGQASLARIHHIVREQPWLAWHFYRLWNIKVNNSVTPAVANQWLLTPAQVAAIAGDPTIAELVAQDIAP